MKIIFFALFSTSCKNMTITLERVKNHIIFPITMGTWGSGFGHVFCTEAERRKMVKWILLLEGVGRKCYYM
jgi:hypothetical protein